MKTHRMTPIAIAALLAVTTAACSGNKNMKTDTEGPETQEPAANTDIRGQWLIENIVFSDSDYVRPDETSSSMKPYIAFEDTTYFVITNCNSITGSYAVAGDKITLGDGAMTEMACDNMETEDALRRILPHISTIDVQNDSVVRLNGATPAECILLRKTKTGKK